MEELDADLKYYARDWDDIEKEEIAKEAREERNLEQTLDDRIN